MMRDADNWQLLQDLFHLAEATPERDRERVLAERCPDAGILNRVMRIFDAANLEDEVATPVRDFPRNHFSPGKSARTRSSGTSAQVESAPSTWWSAWRAAHCSARP